MRRSNILRGVVNEAINNVLSEEIDTGQVSSAWEKKHKKQESPEEREIRAKIRKLRRKISEYEEDGRDISGLQRQIAALKKKAGYTTESRVRGIVHETMKRMLAETRFGEPKHIEGDIVNGKSGYLVADNGNGGDVAILDDLQFLGNSIVGINRDTDEEETLYLTGMFARPLDGFTLPSASKTSHGVVVKHLRWDDDDDFYQLEIDDFLSSPESAAESDYEDYANENNI